MTSIQALGLKDPVFGSQIAFRQILTAMSSPGMRAQIPADLSGTPDGISLAAAAVLLTLCDYETPIFIGSQSAEITTWVRFYTGASSVTTPSHAKFALLNGDDISYPLSQFHQGDDRYPDQSATLIIECKSFVDGSHIRLTGPGIKDTIEIAPSGLYQNFWQQLSDNNRKYPLGVDVILTAGHELMALPRSIHIEENL